MGRSRQQMEVSRMRVTKLRDDGNELVSNIRVAADMRESDRRKEEDEAKRLRCVRGFPLPSEKLTCRKKGALCLISKSTPLSKRWRQGAQTESCSNIVYFQEGKAGGGG